MVTYRHAGAYRCQACEGHAVTYPVIREAMDRGRWQRLWRKVSANATATAKGTQCPGCSQPTAEIEAEKLTIDSCKRCHLLWFDPGELQSLPTTRAAPRETTEPTPPKAPTSILDTRLGMPENPWHLICGWLGLPYEIDSQRTRRAYVTAAVAIALIAVHLLATRAGLYQVITKWGFIPAEWSRHQGTTWMTSFFLHAGWLHLFANTYFLVAFGDNVEEDLGAAKYALLLALGAIAGCGAHAAIDPSSELPLVGASAGISGVLCYYAFRFPKAKIGWAWRFYFVPVWWFRMTAKGAFGLWLLLQLLLAYQQYEGLTNVSAMGHLGGALAGLLFVLTQRGAANPGR